MSKFGVKEVHDCIFYSLTDNKPKLFLNSLKLSNLENSADTSYAIGGKGNVRILAWDYNKNIIFNIQDALLNLNSLSMQTGNSLNKGIANIYEREVLTANTNSKITLSHTPVSNSETVYKTEDDYEHNVEQVKIDYDPNGVKASGILVFTGSVALGETITIGADTYEFDDGTGVATGNIAVNVGADLTADNAINKLVDAINTLGTEPITATGDTVEDKVIVEYNTVGISGNSVSTTETVAYAYWENDTLTGGKDPVSNAYMIDIDGVTLIFNKSSILEEDRLITYYQYESDSTAQTIVISSDKFPGYYKVIGDTVVRNETTGIDEPFQIIIEKAKIAPGFTISMQPDGDPSTFDFNIEVFKPKNKTTMVKMVRY